MHTHTQLDGVRKMPRSAAKSPIWIIPALSLNLRTSTVRPDSWNTLHDHTTRTATAAPPAPSGPRHLSLNPMNSNCGTGGGCGGCGGCVSDGVFNDDVSVDIAKQMHQIMGEPCPCGHDPPLAVCLCTWPKKIHPSAHHGNELQPRR